MKLTELLDGTLRIDSRPIPGTPFYSDWLEALLLRRAAFESSRLNKATGHWEPCIVPYDRNQEQACTMISDGPHKGSIGIICLFCTVPTPTFDTGKLVIGGLVQFAVDEPEIDGSDSRISMSRHWRRRIVSKRGVGCKGCCERFMDESARVNQENIEKQTYHDALRQCYLNKGRYTEAAKLTPPKLFTAWLDVFDSTAINA